MCLLACAVVGAAEDKFDKIVTSDGTEYTSVTVMEVEPDRLTLMHSSGVVKVEFKDLPEDIQKKYGYEPEKASQHIQEREAQELQKQKLAAQRHAKESVFNIFTKEIETLKRGNYTDEVKARVKVLESKLQACRKTFAAYSNMSLDRQKKLCELVYEGKIAIGMPVTLVYAAWGSPRDVDKSISASGTRRSLWYRKSGYESTLVSIDESGHVSYIGD